ncbi:MAG: N-6 DNA methylase [Leptolyngbyaceae cyanobacterium SM1_4_3]|nr:N-6 DNA methylase [Leptolyngbyaceae cyanobacterium SM1_4_3]
MSRLLVSQYQTKIEKLIQHGGSKNEASIRRAFENLLDEYCKTKGYELIAELEYPTQSGKIVKPDGTVKDAIRMAIGYWESKDQYDKLDDEIEKKFAKGYPNDNIIFEDSQEAVLYQNGGEVLRVSMRDDAALDRLLTQFVNYERPEVRDFRTAISKFKEDVPDILEALRSTIQAQEESNEPFRQKRDQFWQICQESINPEITAFDVQEMLIQHILTEDIFLNIFGESQFHQENNIASELQEVVKTFFKGSIKRDTLDRTKHFYAVIQRTAASIANHHEKQKFLKVIYENFYKAYNPKAADRLGIVYTPNEIVRFMIESADYLVHKHFGKLLADPGVEILDPATGTGTFITELIEYLPASKLEYKYKNEIHCNEVAILPYYVANLNIELTYKQKMGRYEEFQNICFVDTLDHTSFEGKQGDLFALSVENTERIKRQNDRTISVIIGNPPYNANQGNFNQNNANRTYLEIDKRVKNTYIKRGKAQNQNSVYDMYTRFYRWATDRLEQGIIAFITNSSFLDAHAFSGFRKCIQDEFSYAYIIDLGGNVRTISGRDGVFISEEHTIFGVSAMTGIAIAFLVKDRKRSEGCKIFYSNPFHIHELRKAKVGYLSEHKLQEISFDHVVPDKGNNWINLTNNNFDDFLPLIDKDSKRKTNQEVVFKSFSPGVKTQRDQWMYDFSRDELINKTKYFVEVYQDRLENSTRRALDIKWDRELEKYLVRHITKTFEPEKIRQSAYRPFTKKYLYFDKHFNGMTYQMPTIFPTNNEARNPAIFCTDVGTQSPFMVVATDQIPDLHLVGTAAQ